MNKPFNVTIIASQEYQIQVDAIDEAEAGVFACNAIEDGDGEFVETKHTEVISAEEHVSE